MRTDAVVAALRQERSERGRRGIDRLIKLPLLLRMSLTVSNPPALVEIALGRPDRGGVATRPEERLVVADDRQPGAAGERQLEGVHVGIAMRVALHAKRISF